jgi:transposase
MTLPRIDFYSAMLIIAEIGDVKRFPEARKLCSWAGLVPGMRHSASTIYVGKITKKGSKWLRWILVQSASLSV